MSGTRITWGVVAVAVIAGAACLLLPVPTSNTAFSFYSYMCLTAITASLYAGAAFIFLRSLKGFTRALKQTYAFICGGFALLALAFIQLPLLIYGGAVEELFKGGSLAALFFLVAFTIIILGIRHFAALFGVHSLVTKLWFIFVPAVLLAVLYSFLPHAPTTTPEFKFDVSNGFSVFNAWIDTIALLQLWQVKRAAGAQYAGALAWMIISFGLQLFAVVGFLATVLPFGDKQWFLVGAVPIIPLCLAGLCLVRSAFNFNKITAGNDASLKVITARDFFGKPLDNPVAKDDVSSLDIVIYAANLVSQPNKIDDVLETIRDITANMTTASTLSEADQSALQQTYLAIENYLLTQESVRTFTKESLRQTIADGLKLTTAPNTFWGNVATS